MRRAAQIAAIALMLLATSCSKRVRTLPVPTNVSRIDAVAPDGHVLKQFATPADIQPILDFLSVHRKRWEYSDTGYPTPPLKLVFYRGNTALGFFGAARVRSDCHARTPGCFESDLPQNDEFYEYGIDASEEDLRAFLVLLDMPEYSLATDDC